MKQNVYIVRHGQTLFNKQNLIQGWCDSPLTELGIKQARAVKEYLKDINFDVCYSSTAERCCDTLEIITDKPYKRHKGLREMNFGLFESQSEILNPEMSEYENFFIPYGGESWSKATKRNEVAIKEIVFATPAKNILIVTSGGTCHRFLSTLKDTKIVLNEIVPNGSIFKFMVENKIFIFEKLIIPPLD